MRQAYGIGRRFRKWIGTMRRTAFPGRRTRDGPEGTSYGSEVRVRIMNVVPTSLALREKRVLVILGAGEAEEVVIRCDFEPDRVVVDPDALVLQLKRKNATARL